MSRIIFMGTPLFAIPSLEALMKNHEVVCVITGVDKPVGRKHVVTPTPVKNYALTNHLKVLTPTKIGDIYDELASLKADYIVSCAYGQIIPVNILNLPKQRSLNVHGSLLPKYRGAAPIQRAIMAGEKQLGITIMEMAEGLDTGDMLIQDSFNIQDHDNYKTVSDRLSLMGADLIIKAIDLINQNQAKFIKQNDSEATYAQKITKEDELINFNQPTLVVFNHIRSLNPIPGALYEKNNQSFKIYDVDYQIEHHQLEPATKKIENKKLKITTKDGYIIVKTLKLPNKGIITANDYINQFK